MTVWIVSTSWQIQKVFSSERKAIEFMNKENKKQPLVHVHFIQKYNIEV